MLTGKQEWYLGKKGLLAWLSKKKTFKGDQKNEQPYSYSANFVVQKFLISDHHPINIFHTKTQSPRVKKKIQV